MSDKDLSAWIHDHVFDEGSPQAETRTRLVMWITLATMAVEIAAGWWFNSMALLADGWHMSSHAVAIGLSAFAYAAARRLARDPRFAFGTWKIEVLAGFASAVFLVGVAGLMVFGSVERLLSPEPIHYREALWVAGLGLAVNLVCALLLGGAHDHHHHDGHEHGHHHGHDVHGHEQGPGHAHHGPHGGQHDDHHAHQHDLNLKAAYVHVLADAATSVLAILALIGGWLYGWSWLDPVMGIVGAVLVAVWAKGLILQTAKVLLDREMDDPVVAEIREVVDELKRHEDTHLTDLHVWRVGRQSYACAMTIVTADGALTPEVVRQGLKQHEEIVHATIEVHHTV
ncbi:MAG: CDF family Co(II)/Ni(II) efflux transporter DmeF [Aquabacterium sp.]